MNQGPRLRQALDGIPLYRPGRPAHPVAGVQAFKVSSNENPYPPLPSVLEVIQESAARVNRYPDPFSAGLIDVLAKRLDVPPEHLVAGTGSVGVLQQVVQATCGPGDEVVHAWRSFEAYPIVVQVVGARPVPVPLTPEFRHDLDAMAAAINDRTRLVLLCSPNNPTGPALRRDELNAFLDRVPGDVLVVLDEAYVEFVSDPDVPDGVEIYRHRPNVALLRTFSKAYGLAGLRIGYAVAHPPVADAIRRTTLPFAVTEIGQRAAIASLEAEAELLERVAVLVAERDRVALALRAQGRVVPETQANFVWLPLAGAATHFAVTCEDAGLVVRPFAGEGARCTIAEPEANDLLVALSTTYLYQPPGAPPFG